MVSDIAERIKRPVNFIKEITRSMVLCEDTCVGGCITRNLPGRRKDIGSLPDVQSPNDIFPLRYKPVSSRINLLISFTGASGHHIHQHQHQRFRWLQRLHQSSRVGLRVLTVSARLEPRANHHHIRLPVSRFAQAPSIISCDEQTSTLTASSYCSGRCAAVAGG